MSIVEAIALAMRSLGTNRVRTFLSALGIVIGVASVITMIAVGSSAQGEITSEISGLGSNLVMILPNMSPGSNTARASDVGRALTVGLGEEIASASPALLDVSPVAQAQGSMNANGTAVNVDLMGVSQAYLRMVNQRVARGRGFLKSEDSASANVVVLGSKVAAKLFGDADAVGQRVTIATPLRRLQFTVVGVAQSTSRSFISNPDEQVFMPVTTLVNRLSPLRRVSYYMGSAVSPDQASAATAQVQRFLDSSEATAGAFSVTSQEALLDIIRQVTSTMTILLGAIAGISLLVGGIGIMSTMLTSVAERTREIGVRKSLGATNRDILAQFLAESVALSLAGGSIGMVLGWLGGAAISKAFGWRPSFSMLSVVAAVGFSTLVGLSFGIFPAMKAAKMEPVAALRYE